MTPQKAIERLKAQMIVEQNRKPITDGGKIDRRENVKSLNMAISAIEKQIPKPITLEGDGYDDKGELIYDTAIYPNCGRKFEFYYDEHFKNCPDCTQALDWGDEE